MKAQSKTNFSDFGTRFIAYFIDSILLFFLSYALSYFFVYTSLNTIQFLFLNWTILTLVFSIYEVYFTSIFGGTIGKLFMRCKVIDSDGNKLTLLLSLKRYLSKIISSLAFFIGYLMILWDAEKQGLHDKIAKTYVIQDEKSKISKYIKKAAIIITIILIAGYLVYAISSIAYMFSLGYSLGSRQSSINSMNDVFDTCDTKLFWIRGSCFSFLVKQSDSLNLSNQLNICSSLKSNENANCLSQIAVQELDSSICKESHTDYGKRLCLKIYNSTAYLDGRKYGKSDYDNAKRIYDSFDTNFEDLFLSFQKIHARLESNWELDLYTSVNVNKSYAYLGEIAAETEKGLEKTMLINKSIYELRHFSLDDESLEKLMKLEEVNNRYISALNHIKRIEEGNRKLTAFLSLEGQIKNKNDKIGSFIDDVYSYIDYEKYDDALTVLSKARQLNKEVLDLRAQEKKEFTSLNTEFVDKLWQIEEVYIDYLDALEEDIISLKNNPSMSPSLRFINSDRLNSLYNELYLEESEYNEYLDTWAQDNIFYFQDIEEDLLIEADSGYNKVMEEFDLNFK